MTCPLCDSDQISKLFERVDSALGTRQYDQCASCRLIFLLPENHLSREAEKARYDTHQNSPEDKDYVQFLRRLTDPLKEKLRPGFGGLDFGSGPGPTISAIFKEEGFEVKNYDPFYASDERLLRQKYDFITCSETVEHFYSPRKQFQQFDELLNDVGYLGIMTQMLRKDESFADWWYHKDPTHVCFYGHDTFDWIAQWQSWRVEYPADNVVIYTKQ